MDSLVQCPVCTLFLHNGMTLESHLDTHPKDQVIKALCNLSKNTGTNYGSRTPTPMHSERSYRSRSRTPATEDGSMKWSGSRNSDHDRYWRRTPSRTPKTSCPSRVTTPASEDRMVDVNFGNSPLNDASQFSNPPYPMKSDKMQQTYVQSPAMCDYDQQSGYYQDQQEDKEIKYSRSTEYSSLDNSNNVFTYNMPSVGPSLKLQTTILPTVSRRSGDLVKILPKPNNILLKTSMGGMQYLAPGVKPMHVMMPAAPTFVQKNVQNNMIMSGTSPSPQMIDTKTIPAPLTNQFNQMASGTFTPGTTVVTQNSQIIYREMVHNIDGKPFISSIPAVLSGHENVTNIAQASSMYQNVMVVDQYGNTSCMYAPSQPLMPKPCSTPVYNNATQVLSTQEDKSNNVANDLNKTLVIEVSPMVNKVSGNRTDVEASSRPISQPHSSTEITAKHEVKILDKNESRNDTPTPTPSTKGLKILSNIKVEVPVQHHKTMLNTIMDLTGSSETEYQERPASPERILPDLDDNNLSSSDRPQPSNSSANRIASPAFSALKNIANTPLCNDLPKPDDNKIETEFSDSCPMPDLICNEKPSISPCSELSEQGDNSTDRTSISPKPHNSQTHMSANNVEQIEQKIRPVKTFNNPLRLNNIYVKKNKKILQIKNLKPSPATSTYSTVIDPGPSSSKCRSPENFTVTKFHQEKGKERGILYAVPTPSSLKCKSPVNFTINKVHHENNEEKEMLHAPKPSSSKCKSTENFTLNKIHQENCSEKGTLHTVSIEKISDCDNEIDDNDDSEAQNRNHKKDFDDEIDNDHREFDADTEEQSMDIEPVAPSSLNSNQFSTSVDVVQVKEEINTSTEVSNEAGYSNETITSHRRLTPLTPRPINVINYGNMAPEDFDDESNHKELLDLEAASKNKQFVNMMNDNYFGDNIYADYFTPDRVETFEKDSYSKEGSKENMYIWGEPSQKESEFVLPNFIHESYKVVESTTVDYEMEGHHNGFERDSKADVLSESRSEGEPTLNICADERMPPRGELSGQESNGDMESPWSGMYPDVPPTEPYDLIARESWVSDGSEADASEKRDTLEEELTLSKTRLHTCSQCGAKLPTAKELRAHRALAHALPTSSGARTSYSRLITARTIKREEKHDEHVLAGNLIQIDSKEAIAKTMLQVYDAMNEAKPKLEGLIKQETKRKRRDFVCPTCKVDQVTDAAFHAHLKIHPLECLTCGKCFFRRANLSLHIKTHLGIKNYKCDVCEKRFITRQKLMEHHNVHTGRAPVKCTHCDDTFRRYSNMVQHRDRHHFQKKSKVRDFVCHCGAVFHSRAKLLWHKETHDDRPKACLYCSDKFVHTSSLTRHVRRSHNEYYVSEKNKGKAENVPCPVCKQVYLRTNLRAHLQTHSGKRPYLCIICNKAFTTKWNLKLHRWTHMSRSAKPYKCSLCKGAFIRQTEYISHMNAHKSVRPYTCNYCGCQFIRKYNCQRHVREHEMAKKYVCKVPECGKSFHRSYYLSEHMKVHSGARPFSCSICGKTSSNKSNHNKHVKIHHAREPVATEA